MWGVRGRQRIALAQSQAFGGTQTLGVSPQHAMHLAACPCLFSRALVQSLPTGWPPHQAFVLSRVWGSEVRNQGVGRLGSFWRF